MNTLGGIDFSLLNLYTMIMPVDVLIHKNLALSVYLAKGETQYVIGIEAAYPDHIMDSMASTTVRATLDKTTIEALHSLAKGTLERVDCDNGRITFTRTGDVISVSRSYEFEGNQHGVPASEETSFDVSLFREHVTDTLDYLAEAQDATHGVVRVGDKEIPIFGTNHLNKKDVINNPKLLRWLNDVTKNFTVERLTLRNIVGSPKNPIMINVAAKVTGIPFDVEASIQGITVSMFLKFIAKRSRKQYGVFVRQKRAVIGEMACELVAGREDDNGDVNSRGLTEVIDEAHLHEVVKTMLSAEDVKRMFGDEGLITKNVQKYLEMRIKWVGGIWSSLGFLYEFVKCGIITLEVDDDVIASLEGKETGDAMEGGMTMHVVPIEDLDKYLSGDPRLYYFMSIMNGGTEYHPAFDRVTA